MSRWFRHYAGMMRDEKLVRVAVKAKQPVERVVWIWGAILESAAEINEGGRYEFDAGEAAYFLRCDEDDIRAVVDQLASLERIVEGVVARWGDRQFDSDASRERQRRYRERKAAKSGTDVSKVEDNANAGRSDVTRPSRDGVVTPQETETDTDKKEKHIRAVGKPTRPKVDEAFEEFWKAYPRRDGANPKTPAQKKFTAAVKSGVESATITEAAKRYRSEVQAKAQEGTPYVAQAVTWLNQQRWADYAAAAPAGIPPDIPPERYEDYLGGWRPGMPTSEELKEIRKRKHARDEGDNLGNQEQDGEGLFRESRQLHEGVVRLQAAHLREGQRGMQSVGAVFRQSPVLAAKGNDPVAEQRDQSDAGAEQGPVLVRLNFH